MNPTLTELQEKNLAIFLLAAKWGQIHNLSDEFLANFSQN